jgi:hypothetical protein
MSADSFSALADRHYITEKRQIVWAGNSAQLAAVPGLRERNLGV